MNSSSRGQAAKADIGGSRSGLQARVLPVLMTTCDHTPCGRCGNCTKCESHTWPCTAMGH